MAVPFPILIKCLHSDRYKSAVRGFKAKKNNPEQLDAWLDHSISSSLNHAYYFFETFGINFSYDICCLSWIP
jgi:hypothetical protein